MNNAKKKKEWFVIIILAVLLVMIIVPMLAQGASSAYTEETVQARTIESRYTFTGNVQSVNHEILTASRPDEMTEVFVSENDRVRQGDVLFVTQDDITFTAPFDAAVHTLYVAEGDLVSTGTPLCELIDFDHLEAEIQVSEFDYHVMASCESIDIRIDAADYEVQVDAPQLSKLAYPQGSSMFFTATIDLDANEQLRIGMTAEAAIQKEKVEDSPSIPLMMLQYDDVRTPYVYLLDENGGYARCDVTTGITDGVYIIISSGLSIGDVVVLPEEDANGGLAEKLIPGTTG